MHKATTHKDRFGNTITVNRSAGGQFASSGGGISITKRTTISSRGGSGESETTVIEEQNTGKIATAIRNLITNTQTKKEFNKRSKDLTATLFARESLKAAKDPNYKPKSRKELEATARAQVALAMEKEGKIN